MDLVKILESEALRSQQNATVSKESARYSRPVKAYERYFGINFKKVLKRIEKRQHNPIIVLDVMCGGGTAVKELNEIYKVVGFGVDIIYYQDFVNSSVNEKYIITPAEDLSMIPDGCVDLILNCIGYTEFCYDWAHLEYDTMHRGQNLQKALDEAFRVLKNGGELFSVPFSEEYVPFVAEYERKTGQHLEYSISERLSWHHFPRRLSPVRMMPVLHVIKP